MKSILLIAVLLLKGVLVSGNNVCVDINNHTGIPFKLWDSSRGLGIKKGTEYYYEPLAYYYWELISTSDESEALEVIQYINSYIVLTSDIMTQFMWDANNGLPRVLRFDSGNSTGTLFRSTITSEGSLRYYGL